MLGTSLTVLSVGRWYRILTKQHVIFHSTMRVRISVRPNITFSLVLVLFERPMRVSPQYIVQLARSPTLGYI